MGVMVEDGRRAVPRVEAEMIHVCLTSVPVRSNDKSRENLISGQVEKVLSREEGTYRYIPVRRGTLYSSDIPGSRWFRRLYRYRRCLPLHKPGLITQGLPSAMRVVADNWTEGGRDIRIKR